MKPILQLRLTVSHYIDNHHLPPHVKLCQGRRGGTLALCRTAPVRMAEKYLYLPDRKTDV